MTQNKTAAPQNPSEPKSTSWMPNIYGKARNTYQGFNSYVQQKVPVLADNKLREYRTAAVGKYKFLDNVYPEDTFMVRCALIALLTLTVIGVALYSFFAILKMNKQNPQPTVPGPMPQPVYAYPTPPMMYR